jgi:hypothetical protein
MSGEMLNALKAGRYNWAAKKPTLATENNKCVSNWGYVIKEIKVGLVK